VSSKRKAPCGAWPSPLSPEAIAGGSIRLGGACLDRADLDSIYWLESRPSEQGRMALLRKHGGGAARELLEPPFSVRTRVHEYGGGAFAVADGVVIFCNDSDQQLYRLDTKLPAPWRPQPITAQPGMRFADLQIDQQRSRVICVVERARVGREPENFLAQVSLVSGEVNMLVGGADFYAFPRFDPQARRLAYLSWNHPAMPWHAWAQPPSCTGLTRKIPPPFTCSIPVCECVQLLV